MNREKFASHAMDLMQPLYYISCTILTIHADREDALQGCLEKGLQKCETLRDESKFRSWITRILINECYAVLRKSKRIVPAEDIPLPVTKEVDLDLHNAVVSLPEKLRIPFMLRIEGYSVKEASQILRIPEGTLKHRVNSAKVRLRGILSDTGGEVLS